MPASGGAAAADTTGAAPAPARGSAGRTSPIAVNADTASLPAGVLPGFGGTLLSAEVSDGYLILHRTRASGPVTHDIFRDGAKVGAVTEVASSAGGKAPGRNAFGFEAAGDRFIVHLTLPDGTKIRATSEHGQFSDQVVERTAATARLIIS